MPNESPSLQSATLPWSDLQYMLHLQIVNIYKYSLSTGYLLGDYLLNDGRQAILFKKGLQRMKNTLYITYCIW